MAQPDRETVYAALLTLLTNALGPTGSAAFQTVTRRFISITNTKSANAPYLVQAQKREKSETPKGMPTLHTYSVDLYVYINYGLADDTVPDTILNGLVTAIEGALGPSLVTGFQQLGIPVSSVVVNGDIEYGNMASTTGAWGIAVVPVEFVPNY